jgi:hypothetical protein
LGILDNVRRLIPGVQKKQQSAIVLDGPLLLGKLAGVRTMSPYPKANSANLRRWARTNEFLRTAINRRKQQIGQANWKLVRRDKPNQPPDPTIEKTVRDLFDNVNAKRESFRSLMDQVIEDVLILDAGCIEKEKTLGGNIVNLWAVNGATILPDPQWDGTDPKAARYYQLVVGQPPIPFRNDQLIYIMSSPSTHSNIGWSPVETLVKIIRAELFGEEYNFDMIKRYGPRGILDLGPGATEQDRDAFREYWSAEIEGTEALAIVSGTGDLDGKGGMKFVPLTVDDFEKRLAYMKWLATKIAAVFQMDLLVFNLSDTVHKSVGKALTARTDEGANALARLVAEFITREIIWEIDPTHNHKFEFDDLNDRDALAQAQIDQLRTSIGATFPNEIRARDGLDPVPWGDEPWPDTTMADMEIEGEEETDDQQGETEDPNEPGSGKKRFAASAVPFVVQMKRVRRRSTRRSKASWHARPPASTAPSTTPKTDS